MATTKKPTKSAATVSPDMVELVATGQGYHSNEGRIINAGEHFHLSRDAAKRGATWFTAADDDVQAELEAEKAADEKAKAKKAPAKKADKADEIDDDDLA